jgi:anti-sigma28 factor (negative regulator of flagellin synthesis)
MRIGNNYLSPVATSAEPTARRTSVSPPVASTADLIAMSSGIRFGSFVEQALSSRVEELAAAWRSGNYRPDAQRIADKLLTRGFDPRQEEM